MKTLKIQAIVFFLICLHIPTFADTISLQDAKRLSAQTGKKIFVHYSASWCLPCQVFKDYTLSDEKVRKLLDSEFIVLDVDWDSEMSRSLCEDYMVYSLPTLHVLNSDGDIISEISGTVSTQEFYATLLELSKSNSKSVQHKEGSDRKRIPRSNSSEVPSYQSTRAGKSEEVKAIDTSYDHIDQKLYTLQAGAFSVFDNASQQKAKIQAIVSEEVRIVRDDSRGLYFVYVGDYTIKGNLYEVVERLAEYKIDSFVKSLN